MFGLGNHCLFVAHRGGLDSWWFKLATFCEIPLGYRRIISPSSNSPGSFPGVKNQGFNFPRIRSLFFWGGGGLF